MPDPSAAPPAGWLLDPDDSSLLRWWDGTAWSGFRRPRATPPPPRATPPASPPFVQPAAPSTGFAARWDTAVLAAIAGLDADDRKRRGELFTAIRGRVLATAGGDEEVFETFAVVLHDADPATGALGSARGPADLFVTDRRALAVGEPTDPGGVVLEITLADVVRVTPLPDDGVRVDLGHAPPVLLHSRRAGRRGDDLATLLTTLTT